MWSYAYTHAHDGLFGHTVSSGSNVYSIEDWDLSGSYDVNARQNQDWVKEENRRASRLGKSHLLTDILPKRAN